MNTPTLACKALNTKLEEAIQQKDKKAILELYNTPIDFEAVDNNVFAQYDALVVRANDILYS